MTKPVENPATVKYVTGNPFEIAAKANAVVLLSNNCVWLKNNFVLETCMTDAAKREAFIALYEETPSITLEAALGHDGKPVSSFDAKGAYNPGNVPVMLHQYETGPYDPRKMGRLAILDRNSLVILHTHYHAGKKVAFSIPSFTKALVEYCQLATMEGRQGDPVVIPMPGMDCADVRVATGANSFTIDPDHIKTVTGIIASTMYPHADVTLVMPG